MTTYTEPKTEDLARMAAEAMGYKSDWTGEYYLDENDVLLFNQDFFQPHKSHDHAQILVDEAFKRGFGGAYSFHLVNIRLGYEFYPIDRQVIDYIHLLATPEQKTRAAIKTLTESTPCK